MAEAPRVPITRPDLGEEEAAAAARVVRSGWVTQGPEVAALETEFAATVGAAHAVAVANGTVALELALRALGVGPGDEVITVSHSFIATANSVITVGARPVFVDVERDTLGMDPRQLEAAVTDRTKAILGVHQIGFPCDVAAILEIAARKKLPVVEDAACAVGTEVLVENSWKRIGAPHGAIACFSFHPRKVITTGDGGMLTTSDAQLAARFRLLRQHAMTVSAEARDKNPLPRESFVEPAYNFRMTDLEAAVGRPQLRRLDAIVTERRRIADRFIAALVNHPVLEPPRVRPSARVNWQSFPVFLRAGARLDQDQVISFLWDRGIASRRGLTNAHKEPAYAGTDRFRAGPLPVSEWLRENTILLPLFHGMTDDEQGAILAALGGLK